MDFLPRIFPVILWCLHLIYIPIHNLSVDKFLQKNLPLYFGAFIEKWVPTLKISPLTTDNLLKESLLKKNGVEKSDSCSQCRHD